MTSFRKSQSGFGLFAVLAVVVVLAIVGLAAYRVTMSTKPAASTASTKSAALVVPAQIKSKTDIISASKSLDSAQINSNLDPSQLDGDMNNLL